MKTAIQAASLAVFLLLDQAHAGDILVIGNNNVPKLDVITVTKIYTGKFISVAGVNVTPVSLKIGSVTRSRFLQDYLEQDEEKYSAYWTVRRYIGKGAPPAELASAAEVIGYVQSTPGGVGYIDSAELRQGVNVVGRK